MWPGEAWVVGGSTPCLCATGSSMHRLRLGRSGAPGFCQCSWRALSGQHELIVEDISNEVGLQDSSPPWSGDDGMGRLTLKDRLGLVLCQGAHGEGPGVCRWI